MRREKLIYIGRPGIRGLWLWGTADISQKDWDIRESVPYGIAGISGVARQPGDGIHIRKSQPLYEEPGSFKTKHTHTTRRSPSKKLRFQVMQRDGFKCVACGRCPELHGITLEVDHKVSRSNGGETVKSNLQTLCNDCNAGKQNPSVDPVEVQYKEHLGP